MTEALSCPYTGATQDIVLDEDLRHPGFWLRGGLDPSAGFLSRSDVERALTQRPEGRRVQRMRCAYLGVPLTAVERKGLWFAEGEYFNPQTRVPRRQDLLSQASRRNGGPPKFEPAAEIKVGETLEPRSDPAEGRGPDAEVENLVQETVGLILEPRE